MNANAAKVQERAAAWRRVNELEGRLAGRDLPAIDTARSLAYLRPAFAHAQRNCVPEPTSGLIDQQRWFRLRHGR